MSYQKKLKPVLKILKLEKPKASCSAFVFFAKDKRKEVSEKNKDSDFKEISAILGEMWKNLPPEEKEYYEELSLYDKCRFKEEKRTFRQQFYKRLSKALQDGSVQPEQLDLNIIPPTKQARPAFLFFSRHVRPMLRVHGEYDKPQVIAKPLSIMWNSMNLSQRIPFIAMNTEDIERAREERLQNNEISSLINP